MATNLPITLPTNIMAWSGRHKIGLSNIHAQQPTTMAEGMPYLKIMQKIKNSNMVPSYSRAKEKQGKNMVNGE